MLLSRQKAQDIPKDAVILTHDEALHHQLQVIREWDKPSETWPLRWGIIILGTAASATGIYINGHYRRKLKLRSIGLMSTYLPIVVLPGIVSSMVHKMFVTHDIVMENVECPLCIQTRAAFFQTSIGALYPMILAPLGNFMFATRHGTYRLPHIFQDPLGSVKVLIKFARPIGTQLSVILIGQAILGSMFTYMEEKSYYTIKQKVLEIERAYENSRINSTDQMDSFN